MARVTGGPGIIGNIGDLNYYKTRYGYFVRGRAVIAKSRIKNDPEFERTRENNVEFKNAQNASTLFRAAFQTASLNIKDGRSTHNLLSILCKIRAQDLLNRRGERRIDIGIQTDKGKAILKAFNFNSLTRVPAVLSGLFNLDRAAGELTITGLNMLTDFPKPDGADRVGLKLFWSRLDFANLASKTVFSDEVILNLSSEQIQDPVLTVRNVPQVAGTDIFLLCIKYYKALGEGAVMMVSPSDAVASVIEVF